MTATELGRALRRWRDRVPPHAAGLPTGGHRRAAGLRREELALLAGISADYVTRLEQGRASNPSAQIVEALARALRLSADERAHLFRLAELAPPGPETVPGHLTPSVRRLLDRLSGTPVGVHDASWTLLEANPPYAALLGDPRELRGFERNGMWRAFLGPRGRVRHTERERREFQAGIVADLRATVSRYPEDPRLRELVARLRERSPRFDGLWESGAVGRHETGRKVVDHPEAGPLTLDCDILAVSGSDLRLMVYTAEPGTPDAERLAQLSAGLTTVL